MFDPRGVTRASTRGLFVALTPEELRALRRLKRDADRRAFVQEIEERWDAEWICETDKAWRFLHLLLADPRTSAPRLDLFFAHRLHRAEFHVLGVLSGDALEHAAQRLRDIDHAELKTRYETWSAADFHRHLGRVFVPELGYLTHWYERIRAFIPRAAEAGRPVVFDAEA